MAAGIGLGAYNAWWLALLIGIPVLVAGLIIVPRPSQLSVLDVFESGAPRRSVPVRVDALTPQQPQPRRPAADVGDRDDKPTA
ncbi:hypothetical protein MSMEG_3342 [Mycolicibacterium smegmatis MC2 155]|uniref:Uncharacterized protein n=1 Tax=Mycolicibacterium smegmatis (strain ATCC 700084 / mc(2)155) TaxID=246196 RepID=A0QXL1_MYCS2|nr:hypothetical protein MSMEG_3342 [Mycolicibacterium smegmatis MC2 155]